MKSQSPLAPPAMAVGLVLAASALVYGARLASRPAERSPVPTVVPFLVESVRHLGVVDAQVMVYNPGGPGETLALERFELVAGGDVLHAIELTRELPGDPRYGRANEMIELLDHHGDGERFFADPDAPELEGDEAVAARAAVDALLAAMRADFASGVTPPFVQLDFPLPTDQLFFPEDPAGTQRTVELRVAYRDASGASRSVSVERTIERLPDRLDPPDSLKGLGFEIHPGDLHVHSCHGEAVGACAPSTDCAAESFQTSGSFSYAQLKSQFQALGIEWFTATDHSYCINSDAEYAQIVSELAAITDGSFLAIPDIELSSEETGPQIGSDLGDLLCVFGQSQNHMGAHGIDSRVPGGSDPFLGFCNGLAPFAPNAATIRADGGYPIVNHPTGSSFGWNSFANTLGIEANQMHGVEIWNGATQSGQGGHVGQWVDWLLGGRILYAYSGSDTHDAAFAFGANQAVFQGEPFTIDGLESVLKAGRVFLSNEHVLVLEIQHGGATLPMGTLQALPPGAPAAPLTVLVHYNFGADTSSITVFKGRVGDANETVACSSGPLTGQGVFQCNPVLDPTGRTYYRAYSQSGSKTAYTNPVFFLPGSCSYSSYGSGLGAANVATLTSASSPTIGSVNTLDVTGFATASSLAFYGLSATQIPTGSPFLGGFLLIAPPFALTGAGPLTLGSGSFTFAIPFDKTFPGVSLYWQAAALDQTQPLGFAFSDGLVMSICDLLQ